MGALSRIVLLCLEVARSMDDFWHFLINPYRPIVLQIRPINMQAHLQATCDATQCGKQIICTWRHCCGTPAPVNRRRRFTSHFFLRFISQFLQFSPYEQHIFIHDESSLCFLGLADLIIHKQCKTQASWVSATDSYGEKITSCPPAAFRTSSESRVCKQPIFHSIILLSYRSSGKLSPLK